MNVPGFLAHSVISSPWKIKKGYVKKIFCKKTLRAHTDSKARGRRQDSSLDCPSHQPSERAGHLPDQSPPPGTGPRSSSSHPPPHPARPSRTGVCTATRRPRGRTRPQPCSSAPPASSSGPAPHALQSSPLDAVLADHNRAWAGAFFPAPRSTRICQTATLARGMMPAIPPEPRAPHRAALCGRGRGLEAAADQAAGSWCTLSGEVVPRNNRARVPAGTPAWLPVPAALRVPAAPGVPAALRVPAVPAPIQLQTRLTTNPSPTASLSRPLPGSQGVAWGTPAVYLRLDTTTTSLLKHN